MCLYVNVHVFTVCIFTEFISVIGTKMASFKPTKIQVYPKLGEKVTQDTLYWKNYKVSVICCCKVKLPMNVCLSVCQNTKCLALCLVSFNVCFAFSQAPVQIKEFGAITNIDFSPVSPHNFAVTAFTRVCWLVLNSHQLCSQPRLYSFLHVILFPDPHLWAILPGACQDIHTVQRHCLLWQVQVRWSAACGRLWGLCCPAFWCQWQGGTQDV